MFDPKLSLSKAERREKREVRRAKQRAANAARAVKMHIERLRMKRDGASSAPSHVQGNPGAFVGCSGWFYWHWRGGLYPADLAPSSWFGQYTATFRTVELNASFYSWPTVATVQGWIRQAGRRRFVYTVKVCELITHVKRFVGTKNLIRDFGVIADLLGPRMGCFLFQLPPSFRYTKARLGRILSQLDPKRRNVVEFRHPSWWREDVYRAFRKAGIIFCSCSAPRLPEELVETAEDIYIRFHGTKRWYRHNYSSSELAVWVEKIVSSKACRVWAYFNNDRGGYAVKNAQLFTRMMQASKKT